ncbi:regulator of G-protein signaling 9 isoform X7 [Palaemon carinicauda]|uniref:regulator of G-protein signaling 9 isoform X7 n=1 Tax=Palaemon carinicauda TaxID=392227 RepID=UPI0035B57680
MRARLLFHHPARRTMDTQNAHPTANPQQQQQQQQQPKPLVFAKTSGISPSKVMEALVREMQDPETGVPIRSQKLFLTSIPSAFMGYDLIEWLMERLEIEDSVIAPAYLAKAEAIHLANLLCQYGYFFPVGESRSLIVKDDSSLYRFQTPYYWPSQNHSADTTDYAIYLTKRLSRNKQKHGLEDYEIEAYNKLKKALSHKWDFITMQADEQVKLAKDRKKGDKIVTDSQERAYWRVYRPPPGFTNCLETAPVPDKTNMANRVRKKTADDLKKDNEFLAATLVRTRQKISQASEALLTHCETYFEYDPVLTPPQPSNPWHTDVDTYWAQNETLVDIPTEKRVRRWAISMEELINDALGKTEFTAYLKKEYCHENIRFWQAVNDLRWGPSSCVLEKVQSIYEEFLKPGAPCEINIDGKTMEQTQNQLKNPNRYTYDLAAEHVYILLLKKDCYPRFLRSEQYKTLAANAVQPLQRKRLFIFGQGKKKVSTASAPNNVLSQTPQPLKRHGSDDQAMSAMATGIHTGDMGNSGIHQGGLSVTANRLDCDPPYRGDLPSARYVGQSNTVGLSYASEKHGLAPMEISQSNTNTICPWDTTEEPTTANICPWETSAAPTPQSQQPQVKAPDQRLSNSKARPDRSKSVDVSSLSKRPGSVSVAPSLVPIPTETYPTQSICPWEVQELPNRTAEKSKSIDVDICPWETGSEATKKASTSSAPGTMAGDAAAGQISASHAHPDHSDKHHKSSSSRERSNKDAARPPCERKISIQVCPWEEVEEEALETEKQSTSTITRQHQLPQSSEAMERRVEYATKPKEKQVVMNVIASSSESQAKPESLVLQTALEPRPGISSEGTSSPSSTCSSSSHSDSRRIKIDYTVRSGHLPGQYGLPIISAPAAVVIPASQQPQHVSTVTTTNSCNTSTNSSTNSSTTSSHQHATTTKAESPRAMGTLTCPPDGGNKPSSPKVASNVAAPWEENPPQKMTDICPWEDEESCKVDTPFVKTYATLGYL